MVVSNFFYNIRTHYHLHLVFEIDLVGCMNNSSCQNSATFILQFKKAESVYNIHGVSYIFVPLSPFSYECICIFTSHIIAVIQPL
jgi:hypothetical protein